MIPIPAAILQVLSNDRTEFVPLELDDARALSRVHGSAFPLAEGSWGASEFHDLLSRPNAFGIAAVRPGTGARPREPRGFALLRCAADEAEVLTLAVHPAWQGRGIGRRLMEGALRELYARRIERLFLEVDEGNAPAIRLYERLGFKTVGRRDAYYEKLGGRATALTMRLDLSA